MDGSDFHISVSMSFRFLFLEICSGLQVSHIIEIRGSQLNEINIYTVAPQANWVFGFSSTLGFQ